MKFLVSYIIICAILMSANQVLALSYQISSDNTVENWQLNTSQLSAAKLLQNYIVNYKNKINALHTSYNWSDSVVISNFNFQATSMSKSLKDIQNNKYSSYEAGQIMSNIVSDLKSINTKMKLFLEQEKTLYQRALKQKQIVLSNIWSQISQTLDKLLLSISTQLIEKKSLSSREKNLVQSLVVLREQNNRMKAFSDINFESQWEMEQYIKNLIGIIRIEFWKIKKL